MPKGVHNVYSSALSSFTKREVMAQEYLHATPQSIADAKRAQLIERAAFTAETGIPIDDYGRMALRIANAISTAVYGPKGEHRRHGLGSMPERKRQSQRWTARFRTESEN